MEVFRCAEKTLKRKMQNGGKEEEGTKEFLLIYPGVTQTSPEPAAFESTADDLLFFCTKMDFRLFLRLAGLT